MKTALLFFLFILAGQVYGSTVLIVVAELLPATTSSQMTAALRNALVEAVFDELFETGHIAFDVPPRSLNGWTEEWRLSHIQEAEKYGASKVVVIRLAWKALDDKTWEIESLNWAVIDTEFKVEIGSGTLTPQFMKPGENEMRSSVRIAAEMMRGMRVGLVQ